MYITNRPGAELSATGKKEGLGMDGWMYIVLETCCHNYKATVRELILQQGADRLSFGQPNNLGHPQIKNRFLSTGRLG